MIRFFKSLPYHFKGAFKSVRRNIAMAISSATAVTVTLTLIMVFLVIAMNVSSISNKIEGSVEIYAQIDLVVQEDQYIEMQEQIEKIDHVKSVRFSSKEEQKETFLNSDRGGSAYKVIFEDGNPLTSAFYVEVTKGEYLQKVTKDIKAVNGIFKAEFGGDSAADMIDAFNSIRIGGAVFVIALCFLAVFLIQNTIKITIQARTHEIAIMRNVGADNVFIKTPFMIEGMMIGFIGAIIPVLLTIFGYGFVYDLTNGVMFSSLFTMTSPVPFVYWVSLLLIGLGMLVGMIGSFLSVNKYLKWKR